jgi:hypothetical protein
VGNVLDDLAVTSSTFVLVKLPKSEAQHAVSTIYLHLKVCSCPIALWFVAARYQIEEIRHDSFEMRHFVFRRQGFK